MINIEDLNNESLMNSFNIIKDKLKNINFIDQIDIDYDDYLPENEILEEAYWFQNSIVEGINKNNQKYTVSGKIDKCLFALKSYKTNFTFEKTTIGSYLVSFLLESEKPYNYHDMSEDEVNTILENKKISTEQLKIVFDNYVSKLNSPNKAYYVDAVVNGPGNSAEENIHHEIYYYKLNFNSSGSIYYFINADMKNRDAFSIGYSKSIEDFNKYIEENYFIYEIKNNVHGNFKFNLLNN